MRPGAGSDADAARIEAVFGDLAGEPFDRAGAAAPRQSAIRSQSLRIRRLPAGARRRAARARDRPAREILGAELPASRARHRERLRRGVARKRGGRDPDDRSQSPRRRVADASCSSARIRGSSPSGSSRLSLTNDVFLAPSLRHEIRRFDLVEDDSTIARYRVRESSRRDRDRRGDLELGRGPARTAPRRRRTRVQIGDPALIDEEFDIGGALFEIGYDRLDSVYFPTRGQSARIRWQADREALGASLDADLLEASWQARVEPRSLQPAARARWRLGARRRAQLAAGPVHARRLSRAVRSATRCAHRNAIRPRAGDRVQTREPRRHGPVRVPRLSRVLGRGGQRLADPRRRRPRPASSSAAASSSARKARSARSISPQDSPSTASARSTCCSAGPSERGDRDVARIDGGLAPHGCP